jgi:inosine/xanthosine triphosphatase
MNIIVGSLRETKIQAVQSVLAPELPDSSFSGVKVSSGVSDQPLSLSETLAGASNRARNAFESQSGVSLGVGLEGGMFQIDNSEVVYQICAAALWDGGRFATGFSPAFELPKEVYTYSVENACDLNRTLHALGYTGSEEIGSEEGAVGLFTGLRLNRRRYMEAAVQMAFWVKIDHTNTEEVVLS